MSAAGWEPWLVKLQAALAARQGVRLGETTVVSTQVHSVDAHCPQRITVHQGADAGQIFYGRGQSGEVLHLDVFHSVGDVDHRRVAAAIAAVLSGLPGPGGEGQLADYSDVQTGTGGGRVTGSLCFGQRPSLQAAHRNHVHVAWRCAGADLVHIRALVAAVEAEIMAAGLQLRRIEALCHAPADGNGAPVDLSHYTAQSDSRLRDNAAAGAEAAAASGPAERTAASGSGDSPWQALAAEQRLQNALDLVRQVSSPEETLKALEQIEKHHRLPAGGLPGHGTAQSAYLLRQLEDRGLVRRELRGLALTRAGREMRAYLSQHLREVKLRFRKAIRRLPRRAWPGRRRLGRPGAPSAGQRWGPIAGVQPVAAGAWLGEIAVCETVVAALYRCRREGRPLRLQRQDCRVYVRKTEHPLHLCLLIDASASMAGRRLQAAKHLVRHLLISTRDRLSVVAFQERDVQVHVPFTRDYAVVEAGLARIQPMGLTPLAHGLLAGLELLEENRARRPLLLLITDGIPTVPRWTVDPLADALEAARRVGQRRVPFGCIGLQPSKRYLQELARRAGGTLHVVDELNEEALIWIAHRERREVRR